MQKKIKYNSILIFILIWQIFYSLGIIEKFLLPSPIQIFLAFIKDFKLILLHSGYTILEAILGLFIAIILAFILSILMDSYKFIFKNIMPFVIISQSIPIVAIAPLLVLFFGYGINSKIFLVILTTFFPITISLLEGYLSIEQEKILLFKIMGANKLQEYIYLKFPHSLRYFFSGLKISISYSIISAVIAEWLGGFYGLGIYMIRVKKSYSFDKMFAAIFLISALSIILIKLSEIIEKKIIKWEEK